VSDSNWKPTHQSFWSWARDLDGRGQAMGDTTNVADLRSEEQKRKAFESDPRNLEPSWT